MKGYTPLLKRPCGLR